MSGFITLRGCRLHNLKDVDAQFPLGKITVVCGPSGCGKSTLVLDTLHGESKRRYLETLSPFAAEMLGGRRTIPLDSAEGLPASLAIGPTRGEAPARATALSLSECDSALRTLFAAFATPVCPKCGSPMECSSREEIIRAIAGKELGTKLQFLAKVDPARNSLDKLSAAFLSQGYTRAMADGVVYSLADLLPDEKEIRPKTFFIVVDRVIVRENTRTRIAEAVDMTLRLTHSLVTLDVGGTQEIYSTLPRCIKGCENESVPTLEARSFSPYNLRSACPDCGGTGLTAAENGKTDNGKGACEEGEIKDGEATPCPTCHGYRISPFYLNAGIDGVNYRQLLDTSFSELPKVLHGILDKRITDNFRPTFRTLLDRLEAIEELGIGYLTAGRAGMTLSGGEMQRLKLASLSTGHLNGLLIALDEPASGLHSMDVESLWHVLDKVRDRGNTLVLIEHNPEIIRRADYIIEMGPGAGEKGGEVLLMGDRDKVLENPASPTGSWLRSLDERRAARDERDGANKPAESIAKKGGKKGRTSEAKQKSPGKSISVKNFALYDMSPVNAEFPVGKFSVITGQSGSGKSTLLFENVARRAQSGEFFKDGIEDLSLLTTGDFHGNRRSPVLSAINLANPIRDLFAKMPEAKTRGYSATKFSTHVPGGRCENCKGEGVLYDPSGYEETECPVCLGKRFREEVLEVRFKSLSIADVLDLEIGNAYKLFANLKPIADKLKPLVDTGLDYLRLGQTTAHLSGGERARLRLSIALSKAKAPHTLFLFDEPARGLHRKDIEQLLALIHGLCDAGHTVIAIEHAEDFVYSADYVVELSRKAK